MGDERKGKAKQQLVVLVGDPAWDNTEIDFDSEVPQEREWPGKPPRQVLGYIGWALALAMVLALLVAGYAFVTRDRELIGQVWETAKSLISSIIIVWAIGRSRI